MNIVVKKSPLTAFILLALGVSACSGQPGRETLQQNAQNECARSASLSAYNECMEQANRSLDEYERNQNADGSH